VSGRDLFGSDGAELERAPKPPDLWDAIQAQVDLAFADFFDGDYPGRWGAGSGSADVGCGGPG
jgi:hypothetical protein